MTSASGSIVLIDDDRTSLERLEEQVRAAVGDATVRPWYPSPDVDPADAFEAIAGEDTVLVVADYDLTRAVKGLFGHSVVAWCRSRFIPVGDFSRGHFDALATEPDLFDLRLPRDETQAAAFIARMFDGFRRVRAALEANAALVSEGRSPGQILSHLMGRQELESHLAPYLSRPGLFNSSLLDTLTEQASEDESKRLAEKIRLLTYIVGHVLVNAVMKYPGPLLGERPLCAYLSTSHEEFEAIARFFEPAAYAGPFDGGQRFFWRDRVDEVIDASATAQEVSESPTSGFGDYHRAVLGAMLDRAPLPHECDRCQGLKGGFWCPFTKRAVCELTECSSASSSWVPSGAYACRVEREFFDEWSPILGF